MTKGVVTVPLRTSFLSQDGSVAKRYKDTDFDVIAVYCPDIKSCAYLSSDSVSHLNNSVTLRVNLPKVGISGVVSAGVKMFSDYTSFPFD